MAQIGALMAFAEQQAALRHFEMDKTYKARLAKHIKLELEAGRHYEDVKAGVRLLIEQTLSPFLLTRKIDGLVRSPVTDLSDPYEDFPDYSTVED